MLARLCLFFFSHFRGKNATLSRARTADSGRCSSGTPDPPDRHLGTQLPPAPLACLLPTHRPSASLCPLRRGWLDVFFLPYWTQSRWKSQPGAGVGAVGGGRGGRARFGSVTLRPTCRVSLSRLREEPRRFTSGSGVRAGKRRRESTTNPLVSFKTLDSERKKQMMSRGIQGGFPKRLESCYQ